MDPTSPRQGVHSGQGARSLSRNGPSPINLNPLGHSGHRVVSPRSPAPGGPNGPSPRSPNDILHYSPSPRSPRDYRQSPIRQSSGAPQSPTIPAANGHKSFEPSYEVAIRNAPPREYGYSSRDANANGNSVSGLSANGWGISDPREYSEIDLKAEQIEREYDGGIRGTPAEVKLGPNETFPARPSFHRKIGKEGWVLANYLPLKVPDADVYRFHLNIQPVGVSSRVPAGKKLKRTIQVLCEDHSELSSMCSDTKSLLYGPKNILSSGAPFLDRLVRYRNDEEKVAAQNADQYRVRITGAGQPLSNARLRRLLEQQDPVSGNRMEIAQALNTILSAYCHAQPNMMTIRNNSSHFVLDNAKYQLDLGRGMLCLRGFFKSVRLATGRVLVNVKETSTVVYNPLPLPQLAHAFGIRDKQALQRFLKKLRVTISHARQSENGAGDVPNLRTICGLAHENDGQEDDRSRSTVCPRAKTFGGPKEVTMVIEVNGVEQRTSVWTHFSSLYGISLDERLPVVCTGSRRSPDYFPMEVCTVVQGQQCKENFTADERTKVITFTCQKPEANRQSILKEGLPSLGLEDKVLNRYHMSIKPEFVKVPAFVLNPPQLQYKSRKNPTKPRPVVPQNGSWNMSDVRLFSPVELKEKSWELFWIRYAGAHPFASRGGDPFATVQNLITEMEKCGIKVQPRLGLKAGVALKRESPERGLDDYLENIESIKAELRKHFRDQKQLKLLFVILPKCDKMYYNATKAFLDRGAGICSQFLIADTFNRGGPQLFANVTLKVNPKLGGINHIVDSELSFLRSKPTMVCGLDVTHPSPGSNDAAPSIAAMVYSTDKNFVRWRPLIWLQDQGKREIATDLKDKLKTALYDWKKAFKILPANIVMYRDGVSEGQYDHVLRMEVNGQMRAAFAEVYDAGSAPNLSVLIVGKRHGTRFYPLNATNMDPKTGNCLAGTVVDRGITDARSWDNYQISQKALQGTANPAHYYVLVDDIFRSIPNDPSAPANTFTRITNILCYLWQRATKSVSIAPPAYYPHLLCTRGRAYLWKYYDQRFQFNPLAKPKDEDVQVHPNLKDTMFFI